jgi:hypothetical protein
MAVTSTMLRRLAASVVPALCVLCVLGVVAALLLGTAGPARADTPGARLVVTPAGTPRSGDVVTVRGTGHTGCPTGRVDLIGYGSTVPTKITFEDRLIAADVPIDAAQDHGFTVHFPANPSFAVLRSVCTDRDTTLRPTPMAQVIPSYLPDIPDDSPTPGPPPANLASRRLIVDPADAAPDTLVTVWTDLRCGPATATHNGVLYWDGRTLTGFWAPPERLNGQGSAQALRVRLPQTPIRGAHRLTASCLAGSSGFGVVDGDTVLSTELTFAPPTFALSTTQAAPGDRIRATGAGFTGCAAPIEPGPAELAIRRGDLVVARLPVRPDGRIDAELTVPDGLAEGPTELTAECASQRLDGSVRLAFTVRPAAHPTRTRARRAADRADSALDLPSPGDLLDHPAPLAAAGAGTVLALPLVGFAAELFNKTVEENRGRIRRRLRPGAGRPRSLPRAPRLQVLAFLALSVVCTLAVEPQLGLDSATYALALSLPIAISLTVLAYSGPAEAYRRRVSRIRAFPQLIPGALAVALLLGVLSRSAHLVPGYVYGLFLAFTHAGLRRMSVREEGQATALGACALAGLGVSAWVWRIPVERVSADQDAPAFGWVLTENVLTQTYVGAVIGLVFGLLPIRFLDGHLLWRWSRWGWAAVYAVAVFLFLLTLVDPTGVAVGASREMCLRAMYWFGAFLLASVAFWAVFRLRSARPPGPPPPPGLRGPPIGPSQRPGVPPTIGNSQSPT